MTLRETDFEFPVEPIRHPGRHEVVEAVLLRSGTRIPVVIKKTPRGPFDRAGWSRADRSLHVAKALLSREIPTPEPLGVVDLEEESWYVSRRLEGSEQVRAWFLRRDDPQRRAPRLGIPFERLLSDLGRLARKMHDSGVFFRDFSDGNVLVTGEGSDFSIWLVDLTRARIGSRPIPLWNRLRDLSRLGLNRAEDRKLLLSSYFDPGTLPAGVGFALSLFRKRIVMWDDLKARARPWRLREGS
ncbi:MAG: lipopolysaccharide kinase InaA family protein [Thermoanaerobaculia bacterium]